MNMGDFFARYTEAYENIMLGITKYMELADLYKAALFSRKRILDSCCGTGILTCEYVKQGAEVHALDQNPVALRMLEQKCTGYEHRLKTYCQDAHALPFTDGFFDGVSSMLALPFMERPLDYLAECKRVMSKNGIIVVSGPDINAKKDVDYVMQQWKEECRSKGVLDSLSKEWEQFEAHTRQNVSANVRNWFSLQELTEILQDEIQLRILDAVQNPLYYGRGYVITAEKTG